ncbi:Lyzozyme M1 (1,4-beta-N-acetylmuramidase), GH25 family [Streptomyces sp. WMMB 714]|uniref:lysozyme n=1 Tax=Streptomyces sp. WMMB 714 TaxID=1286822 RepID=UPI0005F855DA|nr:lysozyme [Streptomyces sp. WMMB 714]SCK11847.1 Lyzozyme M1 (1,4-beta-N-acetylmuramidase), GH25 family [Streptomyces sp. WMMB 714]
MPGYRSGTARRRRSILTAAGMFISALALVLTSPGTANAAPQDGTPLKPGEASMGVGVRMHEGGDPTDGTPPESLAATVEGVDVSGHQGNVNWSSLWGSGVKFAYVKATEGTSYRNPYFTQQYNGSYNIGMIRGAYHFALPNNSSGAAQANYFADHGGGWSKDGKTLPGVLDIEYNPYGATCYGLSQSAMVNWIKDFTNTYKSRTGRDAVIYTTTDWWTTCTGNNGGFGNTNPLWIARYASAPGALPNGWGFHTFWQYTSTGPIVGDHNSFNGSMDRLKALANG